MNKTNAASEIDRVLTDCITSVPSTSPSTLSRFINESLQARPVYLTLPTNLVFETISSDRLKIPLSRTHPPNNPEVEKFVLDQILELVEEAKGDVIFLIDACAIRHDVRVEVDELIKKTGFPVYSAPMGKTAVSENYERYGGVRAHANSLPLLLPLALRMTRVLMNSLGRPCRYTSGPSVTPTSKKKSKQQNSSSPSAP